MVATRAILFDIATQYLGHALSCRDPGAIARSELFVRLKEKDGPPSRKASKRRVHGKMSRRYPATPTNINARRYDYHAIIVSSAHGVVQCRIGGGILPAEPSRGASSRYRAMSVACRQSAESRRIDSPFQGSFVVVQRVRSAAFTDSVPRTWLFAAGFHRKCGRPGMVSFLPSGRFGDMKGAEGPRHGPRDLRGRCVPGPRGGESMAPRRASQVSSPPPGRIVPDPAGDGISWKLIHKNSWLWISCGLGRSPGKAKMIAIADPCAHSDQCLMDAATIPWSWASIGHGEPLFP